MCEQICQENTLVYESRVVVVCLKYYIMCDFV
jgi:hypothetical protein